MKKQVDLVNVASCRKGESVEIISENACMESLVERLIQCDGLLLIVAEVSRYSVCPVK